MFVHNTPFARVGLKLERFPEEDILASRDHDQDLSLFFDNPFLSGGDSGRVSLK